jgi:hypothetical protein
MCEGTCKMCEGTCKMCEGTCKMYEGTCQMLLLLLCTESLLTFSAVGYRMVENYSRRIGHERYALYFYGSTVYTSLKALKLFTQALGQFFNSLVEGKYLSNSCSKLLNLKSLPKKMLIFKNDI